MAGSAGQLWEVIGGAGKGGVLVRSGLELESSQLEHRLATGSLVREVNLVGDRLQYAKVRGNGPQTGWLSVRIQGKDLLTKCAVWEVVGGVDSRGVLVRSGKELDSKQCEHRLATGSLVKEEELVGERLRYSMIAGGGPDAGWVSIRAKGNDLLARTTAQDRPQGDRLDAVPIGDGEWNPYAILQIGPRATDFMIKHAFRKMSLRVHPDQNPNDPEADQKFHDVQKAKEFLLDPLKRMMFNLKKGYLSHMPSNPIYWSDWERMFGELGDPELEDIKREEQRLGVPAGEIDILVFGCTGLAGMLGTSFLSYSSTGLTWALAARAEEKLKAVAAKFGRGPNYRGAFHAPEPQTLEEVLPRTRVLVNFAGTPRDGHFNQIYALCVKHSVHYVDIMGDIPLISDLIQKYHLEAVAKGLVFMPCVGVTALPCDLLVLCAVQRLRAKHQTGCRCAVVYTFSQGGGLSGNSFASALATTRADAAREFDPFLIGGLRECGVRPEDNAFFGCQYDGFCGQWVGPDALQRTDPPIIRRSCELFEKEDAALGYGIDFQFKTFAMFPDKMSTEMARLQFKLPVSAKEQMVDQKKVPPIGSGPGERLRQEAISYKICNAEGENGQQVHAVMRSGPGGLGDGYASGILAIVAAQVLLEEFETLPATRRGFTTAAHLLGMSSIWKRLAEQRMVFEVHDGRAPQELFRNVMGGSLALDTDVAVIEGEGETCHALQRKPWEEAI